MAELCNLDVSPLSVFPGLRQCGELALLAVLPGNRRGDVYPVCFGSRGVILLRDDNSGLGGYSSPWRMLGMGRWGCRRSSPWENCSLNV